MLKKLKAATLHLIAGANAATIVLMMASAYSMYVNPAEHPRMACLTFFFPFFLAVNVMFLVFWLIFRLRYTWIPLAGLLLCAGGVRRYIPVNWPSKPPKGSIKLLTYNVEGFYFSKADSAYTNSIVRYIVESDADIVCLQEGANDVAAVREKIEKALEAAYPEYRRKMWRTTELHCYSRFPILSEDTVPYKSACNGSVAYKVDVHGDTLLLVNNHFESNKLTGEEKTGYKDLVRDPNTERIEWGARTLLGKVGKAAALRAPESDSVAAFVRRSGCKSVVVCGDFNDSPLSYAVHLLCKKLDLSSAFVQSGNGIGLSYNQSGIFVRIDHILYSSDWKSYGTKVDNSIADSDHYPIFTYLKKRGK